MVQQGQTIELARGWLGGERLWADRYRPGGRDSKRVQRGGFASEQDARDALERELERLRRERRIARRLTLTELVETYLAQHDVQPVTIEKLRYLLSKATAVFGDRKIGELTSQEIAEWRMRLSPGYRFEAASAQRSPARGDALGVVLAADLRRLGLPFVSGFLKDRRHLRVGDEFLPTLPIPV